MTATMALVLLVKATCLLLVALGVTVLLRQRASAGVRHLVWLTAVVGVLAMPAVAAWGPIRVGILPAERVEAWPLRFAQGDSRGETRDATAPTPLPPPSLSNQPAPAPAAIEPAAT